MKSFSVKMLNTFLLLMVQAQGYVRNLYRLQGNKV
jgi:hypothetical protein